MTNGADKIESDDDILNTSNQNLFYFILQYMHNYLSSVRKFHFSSYV